MYLEEKYSDIQGITNPFSPLNGLIRVIHHPIPLIH